MRISLPIDTFHGRDPCPSQAVGPGGLRRRLSLRGPWPSSLVYEDCLEVWAGPQGWHGGAILPSPAHHGGRVAGIIRGVVVRAGAGARVKAFVKAATQAGGQILQRGSCLQFLALAPGGSGGDLC